MLCYNLEVDYYNRKVFFIMIFKLIDSSYINEITFISIILAFAATCIIISLCKNILPRDQGRAFAINGQKSEGKPRGAGIVFVLVFAFCSILFIPYSNEMLIYLILVIAAMLSGYLDDRSSSPWGEYKKGIIDLILAVICALTYVNYNGTHIQLFYSDAISFTMPTVPFVILAVILIWASINVTNCSDGVDGLCGTLSIISLITIYGICQIKGIDASVKHMILIFTVCLLAYLWFNASPSRLLMGDAGSRAIGFFMAVAILKTGSPFLFIPATIVLIVDGGLGLIKVFLLRFFKIKILAGTRTPIHDHMRKNKGWSDTQVVFRFAIIQIIISLALLFA